jgi:3-methylcrotonyl-CoA carboxylase beta subunit
MRKAITENYEKQSTCYFSTARLWDDGVILPQETRKVIGLSLLIASSNIQDTHHGVFRM